MDCLQTPQPKLTGLGANLLKNANFTNGNFVENQQKNLLNIKNIEMYFNQISDISTTFLNLVNNFIEILIFLDQ